jgi:hypothetical protein
MVQELMVLQHIQTACAEPVGDSHSYLIAIGENHCVLSLGSGSSRVTVARERLEPRIRVVQPLLPASSAGAASKLLFLFRAIGCLALPYPAVRRGLFPYV